MNQEQVLLLMLIQIPSLIIMGGLIAFVTKKQIECAKKPFICPHCGERFYTKWYHLYVYRYFTVVLTEKAKLKCPKCNQKDFCKWTGNDDL